MSDSMNPPPPLWSFPRWLKMSLLWIICGILTYLALDSAELLGPHAGQPFHEARVNKRAGNPQGADQAEASGDRGVTGGASAETAPEKPPSPPSGEMSPSGKRDPSSDIPAAARTTAVASVEPADGAASARTWPELDPNASPLPLDESLFQRPGGVGAGLTEPELKRWLGPIPNADGRFFGEMRDGAPVAGFDGLVRLRPSWPESGVLRLAPFAHDDGFALHFWHGDEGVSFYCYHAPRPAWGAYRTTRPRDRMRPSTFVLLATDDGRYERTQAGVVEIRYQAGLLLLSRGDLRLLSIPFPSPPTEVLFAQRALFSELTMYRGEPLPEERDAPRHNLLSSSAPSDLPWVEALPEGAALTRAADGPLQLSRTKEAGEATIHLPLPRTGLYEICVEFEQVASGTGIFLGDDAGRPLHVLGFRRDRTTGLPVLGILDPAAARFETDETILGSPVPFAGKGQWLRLVVGCGAVRCAVSGDGRHWGRILEPWRSSAAAPTRFGFIACAAPSAARMGLRQVHIRELSALTRLADPGLLPLVPKALFDVPRDFVPWCAGVLAGQPPDVDSRNWRMTCAVRTLTEARSPKGANRILLGLLEDSLDRDATPAEKLEVLDQGTLPFDAWEPHEADPLLLCYDRIGRDLADRGEPEPFSVPARSLLRSPLWCSVPVQAAPLHLARAELMQHLCQEQWDAAIQFCARLRFWNAAGDPEKLWPAHRRPLRELVEWGERLARDAGHPDRETSDPASFVQHMVILREEGLDLSPFSELRTAFLDDRFDDAARLLVEARLDRAHDWFPVPDDENLFRTLPDMLCEGVRRRPQFLRAMATRYDAAARQRIEAAIAEVNVAEVAAAALRYFGASSARTACRWLGDRALAEGQFGEALAHYRLGQGMIEGESADEWTQRERLAIALGNARDGKERARAARIERGVLAVGEVERMLSEATGGAAAADQRPAPDSAAKGIEPVGWRAQERHEWPGTTGPPPGLDTRLVDWGARELACLLAGDRLLAANRRQIACFDLKTGKRLWIRVFDAALAARPWPLLALRPAVDSERVYLRRPRKTGLGLVAVNLADGKIAWESDPGQIACSDPLLIHGQLYGFTTRFEDESPTRQLDATIYDPSTGTQISQTRVLKLRGVADRIPSCEVVQTGARLVGAIAGAVVCCDLTGQPLWLRRQTYLTSAGAPFAIEQEYSLPVVSGSRVIVCQPGVLEVCCLEAESGRVLWRTPLAHCRRLLGTDERKVYVETATDFRAISIENGQVVWRYPVQQALEAFHLGRNGTLLFTRRESLDGKGNRPQMVWLDTHTGRASALWSLPELKDPFPVMGPLVHHGQNMWSFFGRGPNGTPRALWQLTPLPSPAWRPPADPLQITRWSASESAPLLPNVQRRFPGWVPLGGIDATGAGLRTKVHGESDVLATRAAANRPVVLTREANIDAGGQPRLILATGHESSEGWTLRVHAGGRLLLEAPVNGAETRDHWKKWEVDLRAFAGQRVQLVVEQDSGRQEAWGYWKQLEFIP